MAQVTEFTAEDFKPTALKISEDPDWVMGQIETFFVEIGANIIKRKPRSIKVEVAHPDGFTTLVKIKFYCNVQGDENIVDILRRSGDGILFNIVHQEFIAYDFGRGKWPQPFYDGQMCPRLAWKPQQPPFQLKAFRIDSGGEKRKLTAMVSIAGGARRPDVDAFSM
eukprot:5789009-Karenia_brevis.AAC.1